MHRVFGGWPSIDKAEAGRARESEPHFSGGEAQKQLGFLGVRGLPCLYKHTTMTFSRFKSQSEWAKEEAAKIQDF